MILKKFFALLVFLPSMSHAAVDMFLDIDNVKGESKDSVHTDEIDVLAWSWGSTADKGGACIQDVSVTKYVDASSPQLLMGQVEGLTYKNAVLTVRKAGADPLEYLIIDFKNVAVTSVSTGGSGGEDRLTENVSLSFESATYDYTRQNADGSAGQTTSAEIYPSARCK